jgi:hypothetical protein
MPGCPSPPPGESLCGSEPIAYLRYHVGIRPPQPIIRPIIENVLKVAAHNLSGDTHDLSWDSLRALGPTTYRGVLMTNHGIRFRCLGPIAYRGTLMVYHGIRFRRWGPQPIVGHSWPYHGIRFKRWGLQPISWDTHGLIMGFGLGVKGHSLS